MNQNEYPIPFKLEKCPFCGNEEAPEVMLVADAYHSDEGDPSFEWDSSHYVTVCSYYKGGCGAHSSCRNETPEKAAAAWNERAI